MGDLQALHYANRDVLVPRAVAKLNPRLSGLAAALWTQVDLFHEAGDGLTPVPIDAKDL
jgi:hypothetical protein